MADIVHTNDRERGTDEGFQLLLTFSGATADTGELPAAQLGASLQGLDRLLQLAFFSQQAGILEVPRAGAAFRVELHVRRVGSGSFWVSVSIWFVRTAADGIIGNRADAAMARLLPWLRKLIVRHIKAKRERRTLDGAVAELEDLAKSEDIRLSRNREDSEDFTTALNAALDSTTVPLDSAAAAVMLTVKGQTVEIVIDGDGRQAIRAPFEPPSLDPDAEPVVTAPVKFIRINKKTGTGILEFVRPQDKSQVGQQRFHSEDKSIRRRANPYTGAFHQDTALTVRMQRKAYESSRHGHYWLIVGADGAPSLDGKQLFDDDG